MNPKALTKKFVLGSTAASYEPAMSLNAQMISAITAPTAPKNPRMATPLETGMNPRVASAKERTMNSNTTPAVPQNNPT